MRKTKDIEKLLEELIEHENEYDYHQWKAEEVAFKLREMNVPRKWVAESEYVWMWDDV